MRVSRRDERQLHAAVNRTCVHGQMDLLPNPDEAVVVVPAPKPKAVDTVVLAPNEPNENPDKPLSTTNKTSETDVRRTKTTGQQKCIYTHTHARIHATPRFVSQHKTCEAYLFVFFL